MGDQHGRPGDHGPRCEPAAPRRDLLAQGRGRHDDRAVNVAVALAAHSPGRVAIIDLDLQFGQVATHLNIPPRLSIADMARDDVSPGTGRVPDVPIATAPASPSCPRR
jgi:hypothetical protein